LNRLVVDASLCAAWILPDEHSPEADRILNEALEPGGPTLYAPVLWSYEMLNLLKSALKRNRIDKPDAEKAVKLLNQVPIQLISPGDAENARRIFEMACRYDLSAYDASYLELADRLGCPLKSDDKKLNEAYAQHSQG
jgi:predicted nucleic acid-binding protein